MSDLMRGRSRVSCKIVPQECVTGVFFKSSKECTIVPHKSVPEKFFKEYLAGSR